MFEFKPLSFRTMIVNSVAAGATACGSPCTCPPYAPPGQTPGPTETKLEAKFGPIAVRLDECLRNGTKVECRGMAISHNQDGKAPICSPSAVDNLGTQHRAAIVVGGHGLTCHGGHYPKLLANTPTSVSWTFGNIPTNATSLVAFVVGKDERFTGVQIKEALQSSHADESPAISNTVISPPDAP